MSKQLTYLAITLLTCLSVVSCNRKDAGQEDNNQMVEHGTIRISNEQFVSSGMEVGVISNTLFEDLVSVKAYLFVPPQGKAMVGSFIPGELIYQPITVGAYVNRGEPLFRIRSMELIQLQQDFLDSQARLDALKMDYERQKELASEQVASQKTLKNAESAYLSMLASYNGLSAKLSLLNIPKPSEKGKIINELTISAPISGYVTSINGSTGQFIEPQSTVMEIIDPSQILLKLNLFSKDISKLKSGMEIRFYNPDNSAEVFEAKLLTIGKNVNPETNSIDCYAEISKDEKPVLVDGLFVEADIIISSKKTSSIPSSAMLRSDDEYYILKIDSRDSLGINLSKVVVIPGEEYKGYTEIIIEDVPDSVLVRGSYNLIVE